MDTSLAKCTVEALGGCKSLLGVDKIEFLYILKVKQKFLLATSAPSLPGGPQFWPAPPPESEAGRRR